jgi:high-affinity iron transporter
LSRSVRRTYYSFRTTPNAKLLTMGGHSEDEIDPNALFNVAIATIFAREFLEGAIIIGNYRTVINKNDSWDDEKKAGALKEVTRSATFATVVAILVVLALAIPLAVLSKDLNGDTIEIIEGVSKIVASVCILQLSVKIPVWLGLYWKVSVLPWKEKVPKQNEDMISNTEIRFNVAWNIWREVAECGVFLIPFFLGTGAKAIPVSALIGVAISAVLGAGIYIANHKMNNKFWLSLFMSGLTLMLAVGLFTGGLHEFEEVYGETTLVWSISNDFWSHSSFPMVIVKPFGYSSSRTVLQMCAFWSFLALGLGYHYLKWTATKTAKANYVEEPEVVKDVEAADKTADETQDVEKSDEVSEENAQSPAPAESTEETA